MLKIDEAQWDKISPTILNAWRNTERRGMALLFAAPFFSLPLLAAAYWAIPQTKVPAYIVAVVLTGAMLYLLNGMKRLRKKMFCGSEQFCGKKKKPGFRIQTARIV